MDDNGDGVLADAEIDQTVFVCNGSEGPTGSGTEGAAGADALVRIETVATGTICAHGGIAVYSGTDLDRDGTLDDSEITSTEYVCDSPGTNGTDALVRTATVATGTVCPQGGVVIHSGSDLDGDGLLDANEITNSEYLCNTPASTNGTGSLVRLEPVATGTVCPSGGVAIHTGPDLDANGLLESDEITDTEYVCYGQSGGTGANGLTALVRLEPVPTGTICPNGGVAVQTGTDLDSNGQLEPAEVTSTQYVCYGADGQAGATGSPGTVALIRLDDVTTGTVCSGGGVAVHSGLDLDGDGVLSNNEITDTDYVCNGTPGQTALLRLDPVPAGAYCANGGVAVNAGLDQDGDGYLDNEEITDTEYICNGTSGTVPPQDFQGSFVIRNSLDVSTIMPYTSISGDLTIEGTGLSAVNLPNLTSIGGNLIVNNTGLTDLMMNALATVGGRIEMKSNALLTSFSFAALTSAGELQIWQNAVLPQIIFPSLTTITAECRIFDNDQLTLVRFVAATQVGLVTFDDNDALAIIDFPALTRVTGDMTLHGAVGCLATLPVLTRIDGTLTAAAEVSAGALTWAGGLQLNCRAGEQVSLPALTTVQGLVRFACNSADLSQLRSAGEVYVARNTPGDTYDFTPALEMVTSNFRSGYVHQGHYHIGTIRHIQLPSLRTVGGGLMDLGATNVSNASYLIETLSAPMLETIGGNVELNMAATSVANLPALTSVSGVMWIISGDFHAPNLASLGTLRLTSDEIVNCSFPSLSTVGDIEMRYGDLPNLISIEMPSLESMLGTADIWSKASLQSITMSATTIHDLDIAANPNLTMFDAPALQTANSLRLRSSGLTTINLPNMASGSLYVNGVPVTSLNLSAFTNGRISITGAAQLTTVDVSNLTTLDPSQGLGDPGLLVEDCPLLTNLNLSSLTSGYLRLVDLPSLQSIGSLSNLVSGDIALMNLDLQSIDLSSWTGGYLGLANIPLLQSIGNLSNVHSGRIRLVDLPALQTVDLPSLTNGDITLLRLANLQTMSIPLVESATLSVERTGLTSIDAPSMLFGGDLLFVNNQFLTTINMPNVRAANELNFIDMHALATVAFPALVRAYEVRVEDCDSLSLLSFPLLQEIEWILWVLRNPVLTAIDFQNLRIVGNNNNGDVRIYLNGSLPTCDAQAVVDQLILAGFTGYYDVTPNATPSCP